AREVLDRRPATHASVERRHELLRDRAAQTAVGKLDDILLRAGGITAPLENLAVDSDIAELVDDDGEPAALRIRQHVADQRRLAGTEEPGDDGAGHAGERGGHQGPPEKSIGGTRAMRPRLSASGRPRHGIRPSGALASRRAP